MNYIKLYILYAINYNLYVHNLYYIIINYLPIYIYYRQKWFHLKQEIIIIAEVQLNVWDFNEIKSLSSTLSIILQSLVAMTSVLFFDFNYKILFFNTFIVNDMKTLRTFLRKYKLDFYIKTEKV